ncbi:hypothetical protein QBC43DRAFT_323737, partial [Cladorrhinum sp. PSN259]
MVLIFIMLWSLRSCKPPSHTIPRVLFFKQKETIRKGGVMMRGIRVDVHNPHLRRCWPGTSHIQAKLLILNDAC